MKLIGSKMENDFRQELVASNVALQEPNSNLRRVLEASGFNTKNAYVLRWTPDQTDDKYGVLIEASYLVWVEVEKDGSVEPSVEKQELKSYTLGLSRMHQVKLAVAVDLAASKM
ncbi:hypothetical protein KO489_01340 [Reinekea forsetii]|nr:hypothetical protein [Reinekea forsetii]